MSQIVQANCPGCKGILRVPISLTRQAFRCTKCGTVMQAKVGSLQESPVRDSGDRAGSVSGGQPKPSLTLPAPMGDRASPRPGAVLGGSGVSSPSSVPSEKTSGLNKPVEPAKAVVAPPVSPGLAVPVAQPRSPKMPPVAPVPSAKARPVSVAPAATTKGPSAAFDFKQQQTESDEPVLLDADSDENSSRSLRKKTRPGPRLITWVLLGFLGTVLIGGGIATAVYFPQIKQFAVNYGKPPVEEEEPPRRKKTTATTAKDKTGKPAAAAVGNAGFPRRALIVSVHNYLYANPITSGSTGSPDVNRLMGSLNRGLNIPLQQIVHLSDAAAKYPRPPLKPVIEETVKNFLATTRKQDRILLFWIGHTKEIEGKMYLMPLEGEFENAESLIPLSWLLDEMAKCECRQKILVLDGNRHNLAQGEERPISGPMTEGGVKSLEAVPNGVQVWTACGKDQESNEIEDYPLGLFLDSFRKALTPEEGEKGALEGRIQRPDEPIPLDVLHTWVTNRVSTVAKARELKQAPMLIGKETGSSAEYDPAEPAAKVPALPVITTANQKFIRELLEETSLPALKGGEGADLNFGSLPPFPPDVVKKYEATLPADAPLRKTIQKARVTLWAISTASAPGDVTGEVQKIREKLRINPKELETKYNRPGGGPAEQTFKNSFEGKSRDLSRVIAALERSLDDLEQAKEMRDAEETPMRWKAHYDYILARFKAQLAYLEEYNGLLGSMRKELPPIEAVHIGWRMAAKEKPGDSVGKKYEKAARKLFGEMVDGNKQTPWEVLGKREKFNALGLEWQAY